MEFIQIFGLLVAVFAIIRASVKLWNRKIRKNLFIIWTIIWLGVILIALLPQTTNLLAGLLGIGRGIDVVVYLSIMLLFYLWFRLYTKMEGTKEEITKIVREISFQRKKK